MKKKLCMLVLLGLMCFALASCGNGDGDTDTTGDNQTKEEKIDVTKMTAEQISTTFHESGLPMGKVIVYTEETDTNKKLGRPGQYTSKINFSDNRVEQYDEEENPVGGTIEVFENDADAKNRKDYVESVASGTPLEQYYYLYKNILMRIDYDLTPSQASEYEAALKALQNCEKPDKWSSSKGGQ